MPLPPYRPQLARLVKEAPDDDGWVHELKYDGYRIGCRIERGKARLISRNGKDWTAAFPEVREAAERLKVRQALIDGEVAMVLPDGRTSFQALQNAFSGGMRDALVYFAFDLIHVDGDTIAGRPLDERKAALARLLRSSSGSRIRYSDHVAGRGRAFFSEACRSGLEGIVSKRRDAPYQAGRTDAWVKTKCVLRQEFVIGGFTDPEGARQGIGALLIGTYDAAGRLTSAGKVGTGFSVVAARDLRARLERIERKECPFDPRPSSALARGAHWVKPQLVCEVSFTEWTSDGRIRHPSFQGLRRDKDPRSVVRERAADPPSSPDPPSKPAGASSTRVGAGRRASEAAVEVAGVRLSHPDRVLYPDPGITKLELARAYERLADWMLPHVKGRPLTLVHCPTGISGHCFYMKHSKTWAPPSVTRVRIQEKTKIGEYLVIDGLPGLISMVQMNILEIHTWNSRVGNLERPDRIVLDLDPGDAVPWGDVVAAARLTRRILEGIGLESFAKTTGGKGLHVVVPLEPRTDWPTCLELSRSVAEAMTRQDPATFTTKYAKAGRESKILIDYLRNNRTNTSIAAYSTRARPGAPVSVPVTWKEITSARKPEWNLRTVLERVVRLRRDPWKEYWSTKQRVTRTMLLALRSAR